MKRLGSFLVLAGAVFLLGQSRGATVEEMNPAPALAQNVDALFARYNRSDSPGCALAVIRNGSITYERGYGMASLESGVPITPQTIFDIGSTAKQFAAMSILLLGREGKLSLDDDVRKYVQVLPDYGGAKVALRNLLHHTSGLPDYIDLLRLAGTRTEDVATAEEALHLLALQENLEFPPGSEHVYSNSGYFLLSLVVRRASGKSLRDFAQEHIFSPLGMANTQYVDDHTWVVPGRATGYAEKKGGGYRLDTSNWEQNGDGGLLTTVEDLARWDQNFYDPKVGSHGIIETLQTPGVLTSGETLSYAMGLRIDSYNGLKRVRHGGGWAGFHAELLRFPDRRFSVVTLCNLTDASAGGLARQAADLYLEKEFAPQAKPPSPSPLPGANGVAKANDLVRFQGLYWEQETDTMSNIKQRGSVLRYIEEEGDGSELVSVSPGRFQTKDSELEVSFRDVLASRPDMVVTAAGGKPRVFRRVEPWNPTPAELLPYAGSYWCRSLETVYTFAVSGGKLELVGRNGRSEILKPVFLDAFRSDLAGTILFTRSGSGASALTITSGRTKLSFLRQASGKS